MRYQARVTLTLSFEVEANSDHEAIHAATSEVTNIEVTTSERREIVKDIHRVEVEPIP